ncbi:MAG: hypothetical protein GY795_46905 [Desulfobacterales bacterium]|nr:hypothetical protein [Desulfobacterales bacterium]
MNKQSRQGREKIARQFMILLVNPTVSGADTSMPQSGKVIKPGVFNPGLRRNKGLRPEGAQGS